MNSSWWSVSKLTEKTQKALKSAQKRIDHVLDIREDEEYTSPDRILSDSSSHGMKSLSYHNIGTRS